jgi:ribosomal protein L29
MGEVKTDIARLSTFLREREIAGGRGRRRR